MLAAQPYQGKSNEEVLKFILSGGRLEYPSDCDKQMQQFMEMCWCTDPKMRPSFLEIVRLLEDDVSQDFAQCSFYHEMKRKALEDTLCKEGNLYELLARPINTPHARGGDKLKGNHSCSDDSGAFIDSKADNDQLNTPSLLRRDDGSFSTPDELGASTPKSNRVSTEYDNMTDHMRYGATPVSQNKRPSLQGDSKKKVNREELKLSKIFGVGKGVPV